MPSYRVRVMDSKGKITRTRYDANNINDLDSRLARQSVDLIGYDLIDPKKQRISVRHISRQEMITLCFHMEQVMNSGVPLVEGLVDLRDSSDNPHMRTMVGAIIDDIEGGATLAEAMEKFPQIFDVVFISLVRAGERTGNLAKVFQNMMENLKWLDEIIAKTKKMLMYPAFVTVVVGGVFFFMMTFLVPQLVTFIKMMKVPLPPHTLMLIATSDFVVHYWYVLLGVPIGLFFLIRFLVKASPSFAFAFDHFKLRVFIFGPIVKKIMLARFANTFALMYASGITVLDALVICEGVMGNRVMARAVSEARDRISDGMRVSESFAKAMIFPPLVLRMISVGENTGGLDVGLLNVRYFYDREVRDAVDKMQGLIEPVLTLVLGGMLAWIIISVLGPVYEIMNKVKM